LAESNISTFAPTDKSIHHVRLSLFMLTVSSALRTFKHTLPIFQLTST
jgi:hypothetical protein